MHNAKVIIQKMIIFILGLPVLLIMLYIGFEIVGMAVNHAAGSSQTKKFTSYAEEHGYDIICSDTFVGNSGNGNHVDLISKVFIRSDKTREELLTALAGYGEGDISVNLPDEDELTKVGISGPADGILMLRLFNPAPFVDNIEGH